jgi:formate hydrogenlyase transcriptional activator
MEETTLPSSPQVRSEEVESALVKAACALTAHLDIRGVCEALLDAASDVFGAVATWVMLYDESGRWLRTTVARGAGSVAFSDLVVPRGTGLEGVVSSSRHIVFVPDVTAEQRWRDPARVHASGLQSVFAVPLVHKDNVLGLVGLDSPRFTAEHPPGAKDIERLEALAAQAAIAVVNARLYDTSEKDRRHLQALLDEHERLQQHVSHLREEVLVAGSFGEIVGESPAFTTVLEQAALVAQGDTTALLLGETGTGKELVARFIHDRSPRAQAPFVAVNCAALPEALVESELFGHEKGAFTGAIAAKMGKFQIAHRGTLFLDEIGDLPPEAQAKLLRVLQDSLVQRVGGTSAIHVDVRVIAATNHQLEQEVAAGRFRSDLYYRLSVFPLRIPPLRERPEDIETLARYFVQRPAARLRRAIRDISDDALECLARYEWPGNVRELQNVIERAIILSRGEVVEAAAITLPVGVADVCAERAPKPLKPLTLAEADRRAIVAALDATGWRVSGRGGAAEVLGLKPTTLHAKMKKLGVRRGPPRKSIAGTESANPSSDVRDIS